MNISGTKYNFPGLIILKNLWKAAFNILLCTLGKQRLFKYFNNIMLNIYTDREAPMYAPHRLTFCQLCFRI